MKSLIGAILLAAGLLILAYGGFTYTQKTHSVDLGFVELKAKDKERVNLPPWVGVIGVVAGVALLVKDRKR
jgi:drug/metabolite transporter (DMT)-like permease